MDTSDKNEKAGVDKMGGLYFQEELHNFPKNITSNAVLQSKMNGCVCVVCMLLTGYHFA